MLATMWVDFCSTLTRASNLLLCYAFENFFAKKNWDEVVIKNMGVKHFLLQCLFFFFFTPDRTKTTMLPELKNILDFTRQVGRGHVGHLNQRPKWHGWPNFGDLLTLPLAPTWDWHWIDFERRNSTNVEWITMIIVPPAGQSFQLLSEISQHVGLLNGLTCTKTWMMNLTLLLPYGHHEFDIYSSEWNDC